MISVGMVYKSLFTIAGVGITGAVTSKFFESRGDTFIKFVIDVGTVLIIVAISVFEVRTYWGAVESLFHLPKVWGR